MNNHSPIINKEGSATAVSTREKFLRAGIPYDDIDKEMIRLLEILNFDLGLKTEFCCYGHGNVHDTTFVIFDEHIADQEIMSLAQFLSQSKRVTGNEILSFPPYDFGEFCKRVIGDEDTGLRINWVYTFPMIYSSGRPDEEIKNSHMKRLIEDLEDYVQKKLFNLKK